MIYSGPSMRPTLRTGDLLCLSPYEGKSIRRGDVIVFSRRNAGKHVVHRVAEINGGTIGTRGDNNKNIDSLTLNHGDVIGRVVYAVRQGKKVRISGGLAGRLRASYVGAFCAFKMGIGGFLRSPYRSLLEFRGLKGFPFFAAKIRILTFKRPEGIERHLFMGRHFIGRCYPGGTGWHIRRPYSFLVDEHSLPDREETTGP